jgi:hypothetical protein
MKRPLLFRIARAMGIVTALVAAIVLVGVAGASAAPAPGLGPIHICHPTAPVPSDPESDLPGVFLTAPKTPPAETTPIAPVDPNHLLETSGFSGMSPITYDLGCGLDLTTYGRQINAWEDSALGDKVVLLGQSATAASDAISRWAFDPAWITALLGHFTSTAVSVITVRILAPGLGVGLLACTLLLLKRARRGDTAGVASALCWSLIVIVLLSLVALKPTAASLATQKGLGGVTASLYGGSDPAAAATDATMRAVHYEGWLRRTFGTSDSDTAATYGPALLATTRITWAEQEATDPARATSDADRQARIHARTALLTAKEDQFRKVAGEVKAADPDAYRWLTGEHGSAGVAIYETAFALVAAGFRIAVDLLIVLCLILICVLGIAWLLASPYLVTPRGEAMGRNLLDSTGRALGYVVTAGLGSWLFTIFSQFVLQPGWPSWVSFLMMAIGSFMFWSVLRPDRKAMAIISNGNVHGRSRMLHSLIRRGVGLGIHTWIAHHAVEQFRATAAELRPEAGPSAEEAAEAGQQFTGPRPAPAPVFTPPPVPPTTRPGPAVTPAGIPVGRPQPTTGEEWTPDPVPPPAGTLSEVPEVYDRDYDQIVSHFDRVAGEYGLENDEEDSP